MVEIMEYEITEVKLRVGDKVKPRGKFKKVIDFLASADKETLRLLASFFEEGCDPIADAGRLQKPHIVSKIYKDTLDVSLNRGENVWEEKICYFELSKENSDED